MDLDNFTPFQALLTRFAASGDTMGSTLVVRATYDLVDRRLVPSENQTWPVSPTPWTSDYGPMEADDAFYKDGTDILLFAHARSPGKRPTSRMSVSVEVGSFRREVFVFGERAWLPGVRRLVPSAPQPFVEIPLTMANAYGGIAEWDELQVPFADNPDGKGFILEEGKAPGTRLPNIEDPAHLITRWDDRPAPVGLSVCPPTYSGRLLAGVTFGEKGGVKAVLPRLFNAAFPDMVAPGVQPGTTVKLDGVSHDGPIYFSLPPTPVMFRLSLDRTVLQRLPSIDQVGIEVDQRRVFITYRHPFRYVLYEGQKRQAELLPSTKD